jgi:hypothetical protein
MNTTVNIILEAQATLKEMVQKELPISLSYKLSELILELDKHSALFNEKHMLLLRKYGDENDGILNVREEEMEKFKEEITELLKTEVSLKWEPIPISRFNDTMQLTVINMLKVKDFFTGD